MSSTETTTAPVSRNAEIAHDYAIQGDQIAAATWYQKVTPEEMRRVAERNGTAGHPGVLALLWPDEPTELREHREAQARQMASHIASRQASIAGMSDEEVYAAIRDRTETAEAAGTDLQPQARTLTHPATGQVINLDTDPTDIVAEFVLDVQDTIDRLRELADAGRVEITCRMDKAATWTLNLPGVKATAPSPTAGSVSYDERPLHAALTVLAKDGVIDQVAVDNAVEVERPAPRFKVKKGGINALLKIPDERVREAISAHTRPAPEPASASARKATVKRVEA